MQEVQQKMIRNTFQAHWLAVLIPLLAAEEPSELQAVEDLHAANVTDATLDLSWTLPAGMVDYLRHFEVCVAEVVSSSSDCYLTTAYSFVWGNRDPLRPCCAYNVSVAWSSVAMRLSDAAQIAVTTLPQSVEELATEEVGPSLFTATWSLPPGSASCVAGYQVYLCAGPGAACQLQADDVPPSTTSYSFGDLQPCVDYTVVVASRANDGSLSPNASLDVRTATQDPGPVQKLEATQSGDGSALLTWQPQEQRSCVSAYSVCGRELTSDARSVECTYVGGDQNSAELPSLTPCSVVSLSVTPVSSDEHMFEAATTQVDVGVPSSVTQLKVASKTASSVDVQWSEPAQNAKCARGYSVCYRESFTEADLACRNVTVLECSIAGLQTATSYDVYVAAIGNAGSSLKYTIVRATTD